ncbi:MAG: bifunctional diaminohydroxyphosphoribosylaminopyrimidine deaminase/5-amino-6-(5-phosphoribosylamino)uracil reductase RibD, partial [Magnetospiraceae bacterium]
REFTDPTAHAEMLAIREACRVLGDMRLTGCDLWVTLEPCAHTGKTPPCAEALVKAGIQRCVVATIDPDPRVAGRGLERLRDAGIEVVEGVLEEQAQDLNAGFFTRMQQNRPLITVKVATSLDSRIATQKGESQWITGPDARAYGHLLRAEHDAIMIGAGTALTDNPSLTCRLPGMYDRSPIRVLLDSHLRLPLTSKLVSTARETPLWIFTLEDSEQDRRRAVFEDCGVKVFPLAADEHGHPDLLEAAHILAERGVTRVLVEGGGHLIGALFESSLVDRLVWMRAPLVIGGDGVRAVRPFGIEKLSTAPRFRRLETLSVGPDVVELLAIDPVGDA